MIVLLAMVPLCRRWMTILPLGRNRACGWLSADANARRASAGGVSDGNRHHDHRSTKLCRVDGAAYRQNDGFPTDDATYCDVGPDGRGHSGICRLVWKDGAVPYQIPAGLLSTFIGAPYFIYLLRKQSR